MYISDKKILTYLNNNFHIFIYIIIAFLILAPFLFGRLFFIDFIPAISKNTDLLYGKEVPIYGGILSFDIMMLIPIDIFQKIIFFMTLFLSGYTMFDLTKKINSSRLASFYSGILYMINPFVYIRIIMGHWFFLFSYAIFPLLLNIFIDFIEKKGKKDIMKFTFLLSLVALNIHMLIIALITMSIIFLLWSKRCLDFRVLKIIILSTMLFTFLNAYWILPVITAKSTIVDNIEYKNFEVFAPKGGLFDITSMYGFWREGYLYAKDFLPYWQVLYLIILSLAIIGSIYYKDQIIEIYIKSFVIIGMAGFILASGVKGPFSGLINWLFDNTIFKGMRDSHKFVVMLVSSYSILGGMAILKFEDMMKKRRWILIVIVVILTTPLIYSFTFFEGFLGQIKSADYPHDWYDVNNFFNQDKQDFKILFLPWHNYMNFDWIKNRDNRIANPSQPFFGKEVISGKNAEIGGVITWQYYPDQLYIDFLLKNKNGITNFGELVSILNVKYILLTKEADYKKYFFLFNQTDLELIKETETLYVFKNKNEVSKVYQTDDIIHINSEKIPLDYEKISPVDYKLKGELSRKYIVFTEPYSEDWELDGKNPLKAYGTVNAYENNGKEIRFERFYRINLPSYIVSIITFMIMIILYFDMHKKIFKLKMTDNKEKDI